MERTVDMRDRRPADEPIEVIRIRLLRAGGSAIVRELRDADILLARWAATNKSDRSLGFEVTFADGCSLSGCYDYGRSKKRRPSLSRFMRQLFKGLRQQVPASWPRGTRFIAVPNADLARYVIDGLAATR